jgi:CheY-like chemotaxis protein
MDIRQQNNESPGQSQACSALTAGERPRLIHFLLVEDDDDHAKIVERSLKQERIANRLDRVTDGVEALKYLRGIAPYTNESAPDIVILDLKLPKKDGHEVLAEMKEDMVLRSIPVVILTTSNAEADRAKAYKHHANSYLVKPLDAACFKAMVQELSLYWGVWNVPCGSNSNRMIDA